MTRALAIAALLATLNTQALPVVSLRADHTASGMALSFVPSTNFDGIVGSLVFTVRWPATMPAPGNFTNAAPYCPVTPSGPIHTNGPWKYRIYVGFGYTTISNYGPAWTAGTPAILGTFAGAASCAYELNEDPYVMSLNGAYYLSVNGSYYTTGTIINTPCAVLPVTFTDFTATQEGDAVALRWTVATESNVDRYIVDRSADAQTFEAIGTVPSIGDQFTGHAYAFATIPTGTAYYRVRSMDRDGRTTCTPMVSLAAYPTRTMQRFDILGRLTR